jgi:hypothetical protein
MVPLIRAAQRDGQDVVVSSGADLAELIRGLDVRVHTSGVTLAESYARMPDQLTISELPADQQAGFAAQHLFGAGAVDRARDLLDLMREWRPDLIVHDTLELGAPTAAIMRGISHVTHGYGPIIPRTDDFTAAIAKAITDAGLADPMSAVFAAPYLDVCPPGLHGDHPSPWTTTYPLRPSAGESEPDALPPAFDALPHPHTVYVTLGTIMNQNIPVFRAVIDGCAQWPVNLVVTTGPELDPARLGPLPVAVLAVPFLPQAAVLPRCRAVVSHAGAGTMLGALCFGLPQLCLPQSTDQPYNTAALLPTGAALALQPDEITAERVADALGQLLEDPSFRDAARRLRDQIANMPVAGAVLDVLVRERAGPAHSGGPTRR